MPTPRRRRCKDCPPGTPNRPLPHPGPRCASCHREVLRVRRETAWERMLWETYRLRAEDYWRIWEAQGGTCALCQRATGRPRLATAKNRQKRLSVEHDHSCCPTTPTCGKCTRGLCCGPCNRDVIGHLRDDPAALVRGALYLLHPPAEEILRGEALRDGAA